MSLVFAAIAPHGTLPEAPVPGAEKTHAALAELGRRFDAAAPEATIVLTPHNVHVEGHFAVVLAGSLSGSLAEFDAPDVKLSCPVDLELAAQSIVALHDDGLPVVGASFGANDPAAATAPMDWGVLMPVWVMGGRSEPQVPVTCSRRSRRWEASRPDRQRRPRPRP
jgi:aromatic ring-opening dioxygenase LigB subunit